MSAEIDEQADPWLAVAWSLSNDNALDAIKIIREVPIHQMMLFYGMRAYSNSFVADLDD